MPQSPIAIDANGIPRRPRSKCQDRIRSDSNRPVGDLLRWDVCRPSRSFRDDPAEGADCAITGGDEQYYAAPPAFDYRPSANYAIDLWLSWVLVGSECPARRR